MKLSTIAVLIALFCIWLGFSVVSALMITIIQHHIDNPIVTYGGVLAFIGGLLYLFIRARPIFHQITKYSALIKLVGGVK